VTVLLPLYLHLSVFELPASKFLSPFIVAYVLGIAFLMASRIPHYSGKRIGRIPRERVIPLMFGVIAAALLLATFPMEMLAALGFAYLVLIPFGVRHYNRLERAEAATEGDGKPS
jgi:CDP-diacylglycerol---serine O-phosphatidyltransferase